MFITQHSAWLQHSRRDDDCGDVAPIDCREGRDPARIGSDAHRIETLRQLSLSRLPRPVLDNGKIREVAKLQRLA